MKIALACLLIFVTYAYCLPPCPNVGDHHFVLFGYSKTIHIHQPGWTEGLALNWNDAQAFCNQTYNNMTYSGGRLWEPASGGEYNAVRAEMFASFNRSNSQACKWWIGVKSPGNEIPKDALYASSGSIIPWHNTGDDHGWGTSECVAMGGSLGWKSWDCNAYTGQWICESEKKTKCPTWDGCRDAFPKSGLKGFCSDVSWKGGDCTDWGHVNGFPTTLCNKGCTCCKQCLDLKCSDKGPRWECVNSPAADIHENSLEYCVYDGSCKQPDNNHVPCACCKIKEKTSTSTTTTTTTTATTTTTSTKITTTTTSTTTEEPYQDCDDAGCLKELNGLGSCVNMKNADWQKLNTIYDLSIPSRPDLCKNPDNKNCCTCLKKKECSDMGCKNQWNGMGVCLNVTSKEFAEKNHLIDFSVGGKDDLCRSGIEAQDCCTCFKIKSKDTEAANCCTKKTVGGVEYVLAEVHEDKEDIAGLGCRDGCVYVADNGDKFCFKPGKLPARCG